MGLINQTELDFHAVAIALCTKKKIFPSDRFVFYLEQFLKEAYGTAGASYPQPDLEIFVNASANTYQRETNNIYGAIELSPVKSVVKKGGRKTAFISHEFKEIQMSNCKLLLDSGAFTDVLTGDRVSPEKALQRQLTVLQRLPLLSHVYLVSYDLLIDEKHVNGARVKQRWSVSEGEVAVTQTVEAARYFDSQRSRLKSFPQSLTLVQSCQGVDAIQYERCVELVLEASRPEDCIGLGGWCILGRQRSYLSVFWETIWKVVPLIAASECKHIHIFGVSWYKASRFFPYPPLGPLLWLCDRYGIKLTTDSRSPIGNALWKKGSGNSIKKANADFPYWRHNLAWVRASLATLRDNATYQEPPRPWHWSREPLFQLGDIA